MERCWGGEVDVLLLASCYNHRDEMTTALQYDQVLNSRQRRCVEVASPAKLNLFLELHRKRDDGYHELETVMVTVDLFDRIRLSLRDDEKICLKIIGGSDTESIPTDERNLVVRALKALRDFTGDSRPAGCDVLLHKRIPSAAGLGGASSNAAAALQAGIRLWNLQVPRSEMHAIASRLGSDVPFFLYGSAALCRGRGEIVEPIESVGRIPVVIAKPPSGLSTAAVFEHAKIQHPPVTADSMLASVAVRDRRRIAESMLNRLQSVSFELNPAIARIAQLFERTPALGHQMSGSGSSYFGLFDSVHVARKTARRLAAQLPEATIYSSQTCSQPAGRPFDVHETVDNRT